MGRYVTAEKVIERFGAAQDVGAASIESNYLLYAENELDGLLGQHFTVPFSDNNLTVQDLSIELCVLRLYRNAKPADIDRKRNMIMDTINRLINGEQAMISADGSTIQTVGGTVYSSTSDYTPIFGFGDIEKSEVDPDLLDDEDSERL